MSSPSLVPGTIKDHLSMNTAEIVLFSRRSEALDKLAFTRKFGWYEVHAQSANVVEYENKRSEGRRMLEALTHAVGLSAAYSVK